MLEVAHHRALTGHRALVPFFPPEASTFAQTPKDQPSPRGYTTSIDNAGKLQIEPDAASLQAWDHADSQAAEHLVSWVNACGTAREAIGNAIADGSARWNQEAIRYEHVLREAGYDRSNSAVQECDQDLRDLHDAIQHATQILDGTR